MPTDNTRLPAEDRLHSDVPTITKPTKDQVGRDGEELAVHYVRSQGFAVVDRNWRCELGEIDIVARDGPALVVCEVKTRTGLGFGSPLEAVTWRKANRLRRLAARWLDEHPIHPNEVRIDVIGILLRSGQAPWIEHVKAAA